MLFQFHWSWCVQVLYLYRRYVLEDFAGLLWHMWSIHLMVFWDSIGISSLAHWTKYHMVSIQCVSPMILRLQTQCVYMVLLRFGMMIILGYFGCRSCLERWLKYVIIIDNFDSLRLALATWAPLLLQVITRLLIVNTLMLRLVVLGRYVYKLYVSSASRSDLFFIWFLQTLSPWARLDQIFL